LNIIVIPNGKLSSWAFIAATAIAILAAVVLIMLGRVSYANTDFTPLSPTSGSPSITPMPTPSGTDASDTLGSPPIFVSGTSIGSPDAPVIIVIYSDFQCNPCQHFALTAGKELENTYVETGKVRLIFKHFVVYGEESMLAAQAAECAAEQNKFWPYYYLLMQERTSPEVADVSVAMLESLAQQVGLNMATFDASLTSGKFMEKVIYDDSEGRSLEVTGTPAFFINRIKGVGIKPFETFQKVIEELLSGSIS